MFALAFYISDRFRNHIATKKRAFGWKYTLDNLILQNLKFLFQALLQRGGYKHLLGNQWRNRNVTILAQQLEVESSDLLLLHKRNEW